MKVDPFAVYAAERELAAAGRTVPRELLVSHYLLCGQLRTLVSKLLGAPPGGRVDALSPPRSPWGPTNRPIRGSFRRFVLDPYSVP
jgi:hypothetical protein